MYIRPSIEGSCAKYNFNVAQRLRLRSPVTMWSLVYGKRVNNPNKKIESVSNSYLATRFLAVLNGIAFFM